eukprot:TRINITY_DN27312_c0_g1_i1.p1 TRINITY_DN27312_c0_g1~~TRINITY_DN27312_c0_g1_i1.p1  ORF type:complete len:291 (+),score=53.84 TRINITY_DN27312_c0_g1_i1:28-873(+)
MTAATFWSLILPAFTISKATGVEPLIPVTIGLLLGSSFIRLIDHFLPSVDSGEGLLQPATTSRGSWRTAFDEDDQPLSPMELEECGPSTLVEVQTPDYSRVPVADHDEDEVKELVVIPPPKGDNDPGGPSHRRLLLVVAAFFFHNIPEGMAVGASYAAYSSGHASFGASIATTIAIGLQNIPEGAAISLPLRHEGVSPMRSFFWGQLSGSLEVLGGVLGVVLGTFTEILLPYVLSFAAGAMILVVLEDLAPESQRSNHKNLVATGTMLGFVAMMILDTKLG